MVKLVRTDIQQLENAMGTINKFRRGEFGDNWTKFTDYPTIKLYYK